MKPLNGLKRYYFVVMTDVLMRFLFLLAFSWLFGLLGLVVIWHDMHTWQPLIMGDQEHKTYKLLYFGQGEDFSHSLSWTETIHCMHRRHLNYLTSTMSFHVKLTLTLFCCSSGIVRVLYDLLIDLFTMSASILLRSGVHSIWKLTVGIRYSWALIWV
jgi:hypothetical protein